MSETPRTDAAAEYGKKDGGDEWSGSLWVTAEIVDADFARDLERELAAVTAERDALRADAERYRWLCVATGGHAGNSYYK